MHVINFYFNKPTKRGQQNVINENIENQPCAARTFCPVSEKALCCGSLVLQRRKDRLSLFNGPIFAVLLMFRNIIIIIILVVFFGAVQQ